MANNGTYRINITAIDNTTAAFKAVNDRIKGMQAPFKALERQLQQFGKLTGLTKIVSGIKGIANMAKNAVVSIAKLGLGMAGLAGVTSIAGIIALTRRFSEWGNEIAKTSMYLGILPQKLVGLRNLSTLTGASAKSMETFTEKMQEMQRVAQLGIDPNVNQLFTRMGLNPNDNLEANMEKVMDRVRTLFEKGRPADAQWLMSQFQIPPDMIKFIMMSNNQRKAVRAEAAQAAEETKGFAKAWDDVYNAMERFYLRLDTRTKHALTGPLKGITDWLNNPVNQTWVLDKIDEFFKELPGYIQHMREQFDEARPDIELLLNQLERFGQNVLKILPPILGIAIGFSKAIKVLLDNIGATGTAVIFLFRKHIFEIMVTIFDAVFSLAAKVATVWIEYKALIMGVGTSASAAETAVGGLMATLSRLSIMAVPAVLSGDTPTAPELNVPKTEPGFFSQGGGLENGIRRFLGMEPAKFENPADPNSPMGIRNNNPGNLRYVGQTGATESGGFARFNSMDEGVAAMRNQLSLYYNRDHLDTLEGIINKWAPASQNNTSAYIEDAEGITGFKRKDHLNLNDDAVMRKVQSAIALHENGRKAGQNVVDVNINHNNAPPGTTITTSTQGNVNKPKVATAMPSYRPYESYEN